jgi:23S rRNA pseudouridine1911/1915/1917 synthase
MGDQIDILFEDDWLLIVNKPAGVLTIPGRQGGESIREVLQRQTGKEQTFRLVHRLDRGTSGALVLAKTVEAQRGVSDQFFHHKVEKQYLAIVRGSPEDESGLIHAAIGPHPRVVGKMRVSEKEGKPAQTRWRVLERFGLAALVRCFPLTGRQHQIRVHMALLGFPLLVDPLYGGGEGLYLSQIKGNYRASAGHDERPLIGRLTLHAESIQFAHPSTGRTVRIEAPQPKDFRAALTQLRKLRG